MNANAQKWVDALRSGKYRQTKGALHRTENGDEFCCLGVACKVYLEENPGSLDTHRGLGIIMYELRRSILPEPVRLWLGLKSATGTFAGSPHGNRDLTTENDRGVVFDQIADIIESNPKGLFK